MDAVTSAGANTTLNDHSYASANIAALELVARDWLLSNAREEDVILVMSHACIAVNEDDAKAVFETIIKRKLSLRIVLRKITYDGSKPGGRVADLPDSFLAAYRQDAKKAERSNARIYDRSDRLDADTRREVLRDWRNPDLTVPDIEARFGIGQANFRRDFGVRFPFGQPKNRLVSYRADNSFSSLF